MAGVKGGGHVDSVRGVWPCGYTKLAAATMATLFWAGDTFAPKLLVKDKHGKSVPIQQFLQNAYLAMSELLARTVGDWMAYSVLRGYIDLQSFHSWDYNTDLRLSYYPTAFQSFQLGAGHRSEVAVWTRSVPMPTHKTSYAAFNPAGREAMYDVWGWDVVKNEGVVLREHYFMKHSVTGKKIDCFALQIRNLVEHGYASLGEKPVVIGECSIPMDMNNKEAFVTEDFTWQTRVMDVMMTALERSLVGFTLWTYNPSNNDQIGDDWNGENFSWFSSKRALPPSLLYYDQDARSLDNGGRILPAVVRPYPAKTSAEVRVRDVLGRFHVRVGERRA
ncbi:putative cellulase (glycosyl hydrolase family 5) [Lyophyllum shimeji]|uniref:Cellulase (Glycosyl hydrolase family 5) n=1 Tax=Lyophyllum shimeji TaxID=47721 RepID=A0A9P3UUS4_LYOSH|nr:putative cellulase (glycosyl hydrolase family 5) [Lyophyllum shimeji]